MSKTATTQPPVETCESASPQQTKTTNNLAMRIRPEFPILAQKIDGHPRVKPSQSSSHAAQLIYLDNAATAQKPQCVIDAIKNYYEKDNANVKRGMHELAERSTEVYESARKRVQKFINAKTSREVIFTKNSTEGINLVARSFGEANLKRGDTVILSILEHHSNIVPWLQLKEKIGIELAWVGIDDDGMLNIKELGKILETKNVELVSITCVSNVLGTVTPYKEIVKLAHEYGALCMLDAAQLAPHSPIDVQNIDCDFLVFSGHKVYGPTGIGVLYGKEELLNAMPEFLGGGSMIQEVYTDRFSPNHLPEKFEAGTPPIAEACGLHIALDWLEGLGWENVQKHENELMEYALMKLSEIKFVKILGPMSHVPCPTSRAGCISFLTLPVHPHDLTEFLGRKGICLRAGHHCTQPLHDKLGHSATTRMSFAVYNTKEEIDIACELMREAHAFFIN
jgi:cysteine desulfurase / selenocysteine lyase